MGLLDSLSDIQNPIMQKRRGYDPNNYSSVANSGLYNALNQGNAAQNQNTSQSGAHMAQQYGTAPQDNGAMREMAMRSQLGALQPMDESNRMKQFEQENSNAQMQDAWARQMNDSDRNQQAINNDFYGSLIGTGLGYGAGALSNKMQQPKIQASRAKYQRSNVPSGPINNSYSQGF